MKRLIVVVLLIAGIGIGIWLAVREDPYTEVQPTGGSADHLDVTGEPIFVFGDLYLDGRSAWARCLFDEDLEGPSLKS